MYENLLRKLLVEKTFYIFLSAVYKLLYKSNGRDDRHRSRTSSFQLCANAGQERFWAKFIDLILT